MTPWITPTADGVRTLSTLVDAPRFSPDGALMAFWRTRGVVHDLVERERVYVVEVSSGRELMALDGPDIVRAVAFVSDEWLLVQRDVNGGASLSLHAVPDGGIVAETMFTTGGGMETELQVTADRRKVYSAPVWRGGSRKVAEGIVCSLPDLETLTAIAPYALPESSPMLDMGYPGRSAIDPEGARIAVFYNNSQRPSHVVIYPLGSAFATPRVLSLDRTVYDAAVQWIARDQILFGTRWGLQEFVALTLPNAPPKSRKPTLESWAARATFNAFDGSLDLDAARMVSLAPPPQADVKVSHGLTVLDAHTALALQRVPLDNAHREVDAVAWTADNAHLLTAKNLRATARVTARSIEGLILGERFVPFDKHLVDDTCAVRHLSGDAVLLAMHSRAGSFRCYFLDPEALGLSRQVLRAGAR